MADERWWDSAPLAETNKWWESAPLAEVAVAPSAPSAATEQFAGATPGSPFQPLTAPYSEYQLRVPNVSPLTGEKILGERKGPTAGDILSAMTTPLVALQPFTQGEQLKEMGRPRVVYGDYPNQVPIATNRIPALEIAGGAVKGLENVVTGAGQFFTSPLGVATLGLGAAPGTVRALASAGFAADMASHAPEAYEKFETARLKGDAPGQAEAISEGLGTLSLAGLAGSHAYGIARAEILGARQRALAPLTTAEISKAQEQARVAGLPSQEPILPRETPTPPQQPRTAPVEAPITPETVAPARPAVEGEVREPVVPTAVKPAKLSVDDMIGEVGENGLDAALSYFGQDAGIDVGLRGGRIIVPAADRARATGIFTGKTGGASKAFLDWLASDKALASHIDEATAKDIAKLRTALGIEKPASTIPEQPVKAAEAVEGQPTPLSRTKVKSAPWEMAKDTFEKAAKFKKRTDERGEYGTIELEGGFYRITKATTATEAKSEAYQKWQDEHRNVQAVPAAQEAEPTSIRPELVQGGLAEPATQATPAGEGAIAFPGIGSLREKQATAMELGKIRKGDPELWKEIVKLFGTDQPAKLAKLAKARLEQLKRPESSVGPGAASVEDPAFMPQPARLDFGNMARSALQSVVNAFRTKARQQLPELPSVSGEFLPDLGNRQQNKVIASEPTGVGRVPILGWLLDPRQRARTPEEIAILTWFHENAMGQAHVQALGSTFGTHFKRLFPRNERGEFTNVGRTSSAQSMHPSDVFEGLQRDPNSYVLSPEQRSAFEELMAYELKLRELSRKYKLRFDEETGEFVEGSEGQQPYWTRGRVLKPGAEKRAVGGTMLGARQFFQKGRTFETEQQGVEKGFEYPLNVDDRLLMRAGRLYKAIADRRLAKDQDIGGRWGGTPKYEESYVFQPAFQRRFTVESPEGPQAVVQHKIFPIKTANALNRAFGPHGSIIRKWVVSANNFLKGLTLGFDWGVAQIQGLTTMYKNPGIWADAQVKALKAFVNRDVFSQYVRNNIEPVREYAQFGGSIGRLPEMMAGLERGEVLTGAPRAAGRALERRGFERTGKAVAAIAEVPEAFGRQFQTFLDVAKIELWKARREAVPREEWAREVQAIESQLQSGRMESIGVTPNQALVERMLLLAPSYYRGALNLIAGLGERGASGQTYRRAMGAYMFGTTATFVALGLAAGMTWDEIRRRLNPSRGDFLMVPLKTGNRTMNVGFGGINRSLARLAGEVAETSVEQPGNWKSLSPEKNPFVRWFRAHAAPIPSTTWDAFSGRDYMGDETDIQSLGKRAVPLAIQEMFAKERTPRTPAGVATEVGASLAGLTAFPGKSAMQEIRSLHRDWLQSHPKESVREDFERHQNDRFGVSKYNDIYQALTDRNESALRAAVSKRLALGDKLSKIKEQINPRTKAGVQEQLFQSKRELEKQFVRSLTLEQRKLYDAALKERQAQWNWFRRFY